MVRFAVVERVLLTRFGRAASPSGSAVRRRFPAAVDEADFAFTVDAVASVALSLTVRRFTPLPVSRDAKRL